MNRLVFVKENGFPRQWSVLRGTLRAKVGLITQEHERDGQGKSVFRYRAVLLSDRDLGLFTALRDAKQAITEALDA
jgi:hypothetical protein